MYKTLKWPEVETSSWCWDPLVEPTGRTLRWASGVAETRHTKLLDLHVRLLLVSSSSSGTRALDPTVSEQYSSDVTSHRCNTPSNTQTLRRNVRRPETRFPSTLTFCLSFAFLTSFSATSWFPFKMPFDVPRIMRRNRHFYLQRGFNCMFLCPTRPSRVRGPRRPLIYDRNALKPVFRLNSSHRPSLYSGTKLFVSLNGGGFWKFPLNYFTLWGIQR